MSHVEEKAAGIHLWATEAGSTEEVASKLAELDRDAYLWHVAKILLSSEHIAQIERAAERLLACGYTPGEVEA